MATSGTLGPNVAGSWYPADREALVGELDSFLIADTPSRADCRVRALIVPHAGYRYSGAVAGRGFTTIQGRRVEKVFLLGPSHHAVFEAARLPTAQAYRTPLGDVPLDLETIGALSREPGIRLDDAPFEREHSLEMEIPFLQRCLAPGWRLIPCLIGPTQAPATNAALAATLSPWIDRNSLLVVSSDFTHYGRGFGYAPFSEQLPERIEALDRGALERIVDGSAEGFHDYVQQTGATICGRQPIEILLYAMGGSAAGQAVAYDTSGRITGNWEHSVSYASVVFTDRPEATS